jgi:chromosome segregation ATPase
MSFLTTGSPLLDLGIALILGYILAWYFLARPLRQRAEEVESRNYEVSSELRTSQRELSRARDEVKALQPKLDASEETLATVRSQLTKAQRELAAVTEEKVALAAEMEARADLISELQAQVAAGQEQAATDKDAADSQIAELQRQLQTPTTGALDANSEQVLVEMRTLEARMASAQAEAIQLKANLANLANENDSLKWRISTMQVENQLLRTQSSSVLSELETLLWRITPILRRPQDPSLADNPWLRSNVNVEASRPVLPQLVQHNHEQEVRPPAPE